MLSKWMQFSLNDDDLLFDRKFRMFMFLPGRRHVQTNIADFSTSSLNDGDSFVIVTPKELFCWHGRYANVIEKAKVSLELFSISLIH